MEKLETEAAALREAGHQAETASLDVTDNDSIASIADAHPDVDILVVVAGTNIRRRSSSTRPTSIST